MKSSTLFLTALTATLSGCGQAADGDFVRVRVHFGSDSARGVLLPFAPRSYAATTPCKIPKLRLDVRHEFTRSLVSVPLDGPDFDYASISDASVPAGTELLAINATDVTVRKGPNRFILSGVFYSNVASLCAAGPTSYPIFGRTELIDVQDGMSLAMDAMAFSSGFKVAPFPVSQDNPPADIGGTRFLNLTVNWTSPPPASCTFTALEVTDELTGFTVSGTGKRQYDSIGSHHVLGPLFPHREYTLHYVIAKNTETAISARKHKQVPGIHVNPDHTSITIDPTDETGAAFVCP